jgi:hypothetical protein
VGTAATQFFRSIGGTIGVAIFGSLLSTRFGYWFGQQVPESARTALSPEVLRVVSNPQSLMQSGEGQASGGGLAAIVAANPQLQPVVDQLAQAVRASLALTIDDIFRISFVLVLLATVLSLFLPEIPLGKRLGAAAPHDARPVVSEDAALPAGGLH